MFLQIFCIYKFSNFNIKNVRSTKIFHFCVQQQLSVKTGRYIYFIQQTESFTSNVIFHIWTNWRLPEPEEFVELPAEMKIKQRSEFLGIANNNLVANVPKT